MLEEVILPKSWQVQINQCDLEEEANLVVLQIQINTYQANCPGNGWGIGLGGKWLV
ncbi:MAG: hypothetical protein WCS37_04010 [Chloroflexota bacterium]|nr:hypothetical protein [Chloroflexota bacterium]